MNIYTDTAGCSSAICGDCLAKTSHIDVCPDCGRPEGEDFMTTVKVPEGCLLITDGEEL